MKAKKIGSSLLLTLTALIWGVAFVAQSVGMDHVGPYTFNAARFIIGGVVLLPVVAIFSKKKVNAASVRIGIIGGVCCGACLSVASSLQQVGILYSDSVGKVGFITSLYIIIVPLLGIFMGKKVSVNVWISVLIAAAGMYLLCFADSFLQPGDSLLLQADGGGGSGGFSLQPGDLLVLLCAVGFSVHILVIDYFSPKADGVLISCIQFFVAGFVCTVLTVLFEKPSMENILAAKGPILYAGVLSSGVGYTLQVVAQKQIEPTVASLLMSLESVFSVIAGVFLLEQLLSAAELLGCVLVFAAIVLAQLPYQAWKEGQRPAVGEVRPDMK